RRARDARGLRLESAAHARWSGGQANSMSAASPAQDAAQGGWIVLKFGGTSVSRRHRWDTIGKLAKQRAEATGGRVLVVVSALSGVTNELTAIADGSEDAAARVAALEAAQPGAPAGPAPRRHPG